MARLRFTATWQASVRSSKPGGSWFYDEAFSGFGVWVGPEKFDARGRSLGCRKSWFVEVPAGKGKRRRVTIGDASPATGLSLDDARRTAEQLRDAAAAGEQVSGVRGRPAALHTLGDLIDQRLADPARQARPGYRSERLHLGRCKALIGDRPLAALSAEDLKRFYQEQLTHGTRTANSAWIRVNALLNSAWQAGTIRENPARRVPATDRKRDAPPRTRTLSTEEAARLAAAIDAEPTANRRCLWRLLMTTGARSGEALAARWRDLALGGRPTWTIPNSKTGAARVLPLAERMAEDLRQLRASRTPPPLDGDKVFLPGQGRTISIQVHWRALAERAGLPVDVRLHDLRRSVGLAVTRRHGLRAAQLQLGHASISMTAKTYSPLGLDDARPVAEDVASFMLGLPEAPAKPRRKREKRPPGEK